MAVRPHDVALIQKLNKTELSMSYLIRDNEAELPNSIK